MFESIERAKKWLINFKNQRINTISIRNSVYFNIDINL
jgi:hypothetical protein